MPFLSVFDFALKGKVPVVCHSFLIKWEEENSLRVGFYGVNSSFHIKPIMYDGVVVLTNVSYIFLLVFILTLVRETVVSCRVRR